MARCSHCGEENPERFRFCGSCGRSLARTCSNCGAEVPAGFRFCGECGTPLEAETAEPAVREAPASERRLVSVLFADLVGFTTLSESRDAEEVRDRRAPHGHHGVADELLHGAAVQGDQPAAPWRSSSATP